MKIVQIMKLATVLTEYVAQFVKKILAQIVPLALVSSISRNVIVHQVLPVVLTSNATARNALKQNAAQIQIVQANWLVLINYAQILAPKARCAQLNKNVKF